MSSEDHFLYYNLFLGGSGVGKEEAISNVVCSNRWLLSACLVLMDLKRLLGNQSNEEAKKKRKFKKGKRHRKIIAVSIATLFHRWSLWSKQKWNNSLLRNVQVPENSKLLRTNNSFVHTEFLYLWTNLQRVEFSLKQNCIETVITRPFSPGVTGSITNSRIALILRSHVYDLLLLEDLNHLFFLFDFPLGAVKGIKLGSASSLWRQTYVADHGMSVAL